MSLPVSTTVDKRHPCPTARDVLMTYKTFIDSYDSVVLWPQFSQTLEVVQAVPGLKTVSHVTCKAS